MKNINFAESQKLQQIAIACEQIIRNNTSAAQSITVVYCDKANKTLTISVPWDDKTLFELPEGGSYFTWII